MLSYERWRNMLNKGIHETTCTHCGCYFEDDKPEVSDQWGDFHFICAKVGTEEIKRDYNLSMLEWERERSEIQIRDDNAYEELKLLADEHTLEYIDFERREHNTWDYEIVDVSKCKGKALAGHEYFYDDDCTIRKVYNDVDNCSWTETYGGDIYIHIKGRKYFKMVIGG